MLMHALQVDGKQKVMFALTQIKGVGRRYSNLVCKKADVDLSKRYAHSLPAQPTFLYIGALQNSNKISNAGFSLQRR